MSKYEGFLIVIWILFQIITVGLFMDKFITIDNWMWFFTLGKNKRK